jgi:HSP20 family protein
MLGHDAPTTSPLVNVLEKDDQYIIQLAAPGLNKVNFKVHVDGDRLTISYQESKETNEVVEKFTRREYSYQSFSRSFQINDEIQNDKITAQYENGILYVTCPKNKIVIDHKVKNIEIQ